MATVKYANPTSGPSAGGIGWIDWGDISIAPGETISGVSVTLANSYTVTFDVSNTIISGDGFTFYFNQTPVEPTAPFGTLGYTDINGNTGVEPFNDYIITVNSSVVAVYNIQVIRPVTVTSARGLSAYSSTATNFTIVAAEILTENSGGDASTESQTYTTYNSIWNPLTWLGNTSSPVVSGMGTNIFNMVAVSNDNGAPVIYTNNPTQVSATIVSATGLQSFSFGISVSVVIVRCYITDRINPADQFVLSITGTPSSFVVTTGSSTGLQAEEALVEGIPGNTYTINEAMAPGSVSSLSQYNQTVTWSQLTPAGTPPPYPGALGNSVDLALGDVFVVNIVNSPKGRSRGVEFL